LRGRRNELALLAATRPPLGSKLWNCRQIWTSKLRWATMLQNVVPRTNKSNARLIVVGRLSCRTPVRRAPWSPKPDQNMVLKLCPEFGRAFCAIFVSGPHSAPGIWAQNRGHKPEEGVAVLERGLRNCWLGRRQIAANRQPRKSCRDDVGNADNPAKASASPRLSAHDPSLSSLPHRGRRGPAKLQATNVIVIADKLRPRSQTQANPFAGPSTSPLRAKQQKLRSTDPRPPSSSTTRRRPCLAAETG